MSLLAFLKERKKKEIKEKTDPAEAVLHGSLLEFLAVSPFGYRR
jgi:hypothetical protein